MLWLLQHPQHLLSCLSKSKLIERSRHRNLIGQIGFIGSESDWSDRNRRSDGRVLGNTIPTIPTIPTVILTVVTQVSSIPTIPHKRLVDADPF